MDWLYALLGIVVMFTVAFLLGWTEKHVKRSVAKAFIWIGSVFLLLALGLWGNLGQIFGKSALIFLLIARNIPLWLVYTVLGLGVVFFLRYVLILLVESIADLGVEVEKTNARIALMESSLKAKLDDIDSHLSEMK
jgi:hypothetical protein